jgi:1-deoxy-D-xylulose-5-phosphate reductoisomerase
MNKGLEVIEAHYLFGLSEDRIGVVVHPQSILHGLAVFRDGSVIAQLGLPDMRAPLAYALAWPEPRLPSGVAPLDLTAIGRLEFEPPDPERFPLLEYAREALRRGGAAPAVLNAANEVAVDAFLGRRIGFLDIARLIERVMAQPVADAPLTDIEDALEADREARCLAYEELARLADETSVKESGRAC